MSNTRMIRSVADEYGVGWLANRALYSLKLKTMATVPCVDRCFEKKSDYPSRLDIFSIDVDALREFIRSLDPEDASRLVQEADKACNGIVTGFSSIELDYGTPIDWQLNPLTGERCDEKRKWYAIPDFDGRRGDIKVVWEASRFSHFVTLARAYLLTNDKKYYEAFSLQLSDWLRKNPYGYGANFKCGQECSLRMINALLASTVFRAVGMSTDADLSNMRDLVDRCYRKVLANFFYAYRCIKNNHTISELVGMIVGAWCCCDQRRLNKAYEMLNKVVIDQFGIDGGYRQFSFTYQRLALQDLEVVLSIQEQTGRCLPQAVMDRLRNAAWLMYECQDESGDMPNYGSNDGALVFPVTSCGYRDFRPVINTIYSLTSGSQLYDSGKHTEELLWFSGGKSAERFETRKRERESSQFFDAGVFTLRGARSWAMVVLNDYCSRPAHMDQLHLDLWVDGENVLCDAGTYSYASPDGRHLAINESHNTAVVDGALQMNTHGPFLVYDWTKRVLGKCNDSCFEGKAISQNGYTHTRTVRRHRASYEVVDEVDKDYSVLFHTPCDVRKEDGKYLLSRNGEVLCKLSSTGNVTVEKAERSLYYLRKEETTRLSIRGTAGQRIKTVIETI